METSSSHEGSHDELVLLTAVNETALISAMGTVCNGLIKLEEVEESSDIKCMSSSQLLSLYTLDPTRSSRPKKAADIVEKIIDSGPPSNRIDVVFMGDGYTLSEKSKFFDDIRRLASDMWSDTTFATVRPLVNVWAVFRPSAFSGIGVGGRARDTPFGLYRDGTELRGIYCSKPSAARQACQSTGPDACDFPSLIGNDDYYGGLGGEFTISTRSILSGTVVLRHELGHNFISVGEEYVNENLLQFGVECSC